MREVLFLPNECILSLHAVKKVIAQSKTNRTDAPYNLLRTCVWLQRMSYAFTKVFSSVC